MDQEPKPPTEKPAAIVHTRDRVAIVALDWPLTVDGKLLTSVVVKRLTTKEVAAFLAKVQAAPDDEEARYPMFFDRDGGPISDEVFDQFDDDDSVKLNKVALDFLPQRFRPGATTISSSGPEAGENTAASSAAP